MKCSICNAENPPDATSCHQCGFSFGLGQPVWPDFPTVEVPEIDDVVQWPEEFPEIEAPPVLSGPEIAWPEDNVLTTSIEIEPTPPLHSDVVTEETPTPEAEYPSDDELARSHIARGFEAIRKGLLDQAQWEFEQARDLADNMNIVRMAQAQLDELYEPTRPPIPEQIQPTGELVQPFPVSAKRVPKKDKSVSVPTDWNPAIRLGSIMGALNGVLTGLGAVLCSGLFFSPLFGFIAGRQVARQTNKTSQPPSAAHALIAGGITGLGGWLGEVIGHPIWLAFTGDLQDPFLATMLFVACVPGTFYILIAIVASFLGWRTKTSQK